MTTTGQLIADRSCTAACVVAATDPSRCRCVCAGRYHGLVGGAFVDALLEARHRGLHHLNDRDIVATII